MEYIKIILLLGCCLFFNSIFTREGFLSTSVKDIKGKTKKVSEYVAQEGLTVFIFWKSCCPNSLGVLSSLQDALEESEESDVPLTFVLVFMDDSRSVGRVTYRWSLWLDMGSYFGCEPSVISQYEYDNPIAVACGESKRRRSVQMQNNIFCYWCRILFERNKEFKIKLRDHGN